MITGLAQRVLDRFGFAAPGPSSDDGQGTPRPRVSKGSGPGGSGGEGPGGGGPGGRPPTPQPSRSLFGLVAFMVLIMVAFMLLNTQHRGREITVQEFANLYPNSIDTDSVIVRDESIEARLTGSETSAVIIPLNMATRETITSEVLRITSGNVKSVAAKPWVTLFYTFVPLLLIVLLGWYLIGRMLRGAGAGAGMLGNFGKSRHRTLNKEMTGVNFADVAGVDEAKEEVHEIIEFLKNPKRFAKLGGRIPRGVLLVGEPGCGKTLLAKAIAGEADVPFFSISGSDFVEMFVGVGASRVRDLFKQAKESAPCIIFLDEIDAVGRRRGSGYNTGGHDEREQTLNAILVEMDGFTPSDGVIVIAATNRADVLDPALVRPGRFDRQVTVPLPDIKGRVEILRVHAKKVKMGPDVDLERVARGTPMFSGADLAAIINEAAISATMQEKDFVEHEDLEEARDKVKFGRAKKSRVREAEENRATAYHEAGHAVLNALLKDADPLHKVTIIPRGNYGGASFSLPEKDRHGYGRRWLNAHMRIACGGRIAEEKATGDISSGASQDILQITGIARAMVLEWGMSDRLGFVRYHGVDTRERYIAERDFSEDTASEIDHEVKRLVDEAFNDATRILEDNWEKVIAVAEALLKHETLSGDEVHRLMRGEMLTRPTVSQILKAESRKPADPKAPRAGDAPPDLPPGTMPTPA